MQVLSCLIAKSLCLKAVAGYFCGSPKMSRLVTPVSKLKKLTCSCIFSVSHFRFSIDESLRRHSTSGWLGFANIVFDKEDIVFPCRLGSSHADLLLSYKFKKARNY